MSQAATAPMPAIYIPHGGGPCFFMDWTPRDTWASMGDFLRGLIRGLAVRPRVILMVSAHWMTDDFAVTGAAAPELIYDYYGFPPHTYQLRYPAPGDPALAGRVVDLLGAAGLAAHVDPARGFDHGMFIPLLLAALAPLLSLQPSCCTR